MGEPKNPFFNQENQALQKEKELFENLKKTEKFILEMIAEDKDYREKNPEGRLTEEQFTKVFEQVKHSDTHKERMSKRAGSLEGFVPYEDRDETRKTYELLPETLKDKFTPAQLWEEMDVFNFIDEAQKLTKEHWEIHSRKLLEDVFALYDHFANSKFTTSLDGSASAFEEGWLTEEKYKSLYYTFPLANNTLMSRRFKMVMILNHGLEKVIDEMSDIIVFLDLNLKGQQKDSFTPKVGLSVQEYFSGMDLVGNDTPHKISVKDVPKVQGAYNWKYNHQGTEVDEIIFQK